MRCAVHTSVGEWTVDRVDQVGGAHRSTHQYDDWGCRLRAFGDRPCNVVAVLGLFDACMSDGDAEAPRAWARARSDLARHAVAEPLCMSFNKISCTPWPPANVAQTVNALVDLLLCLCCAAQAHEEVASLRIRMRSQEGRRHTHVLTQTCWVPVNRREFDQHNSIFARPSIVNGLGTRHIYL